MFFKYEAKAYCRCSIRQARSFNFVDYQFTLVQATCLLIINKYLSNKKKRSLMPRFASRRGAPRANPSRIHVQNLCEFLFNVSNDEFARYIHITSNLVNRMQPVRFPLRIVVCPNH